MDTSHEYIEMCCKAEEIQQPWKGNWKPGDYIDDGQILTDDFITRCENDDEVFLHYSIWLPRQDQLQEMVKSDKHPHWQLNDFIDSGQADYQQETSDYAKQFTTMEQLWLAFVMKEKFNKVWKNGDWIEDK